MEEIKRIINVINDRCNVKYIIPNWPSIRLIGQCNTVKLTMLIPFVGYLILFNKDIVSIINSAFEITGDSTTLIETKNKLYFIYFGLTSIGIATILFQLLCPKLIKEYSSARVYLENNIGYMTKYRLNSLCNHIDSLSDEKHLVIERGKEISNQPHSQEGNILRETYIDVLQHFWNISAWNKCSFRLTITMLYVSGFILLFIPSLNMFLKVVFTA